MALNQDKLNMLPATAVVLISVAIVVATGALVLAEFQDSDVNLVDEQITDEKHQPTATNGINSSSGFQQFTLDHVGPEGVKSASLDFSDVGTGNVTLTQGDNYTVTASSGTINVTKVDDYDSSAGDAFFADYTNTTRRTSHAVLGDGVGALQTIADFFTVFVILVVASVLFALLMVLRRPARNASV